MVNPSSVGRVFEADRGRYLTQFRMVGRRNREATLLDYCWPDSMKSFPPELLDARSDAEFRQVKKIAWTYHGRAVEETRAPIPGQLGTVHIGVWRDAVEAEVRKTVRPVVGLIGLIICVGISAVILLAHQLIRPIRQLATLATKLSTGDLETPLSAESNDEIADLARSLCRLG